MVAWKGIVGTSFSPTDFDSYCHALTRSAWRPSFIVLHNTASPSLSQRLKGLTKQHILNLEAFYRGTQHWKAGPHLFVDDLQIWVFTPLTVSGTHSPSFNEIALGIEMLGDYDKDEFDSGRGLKVQNNAIAAVATLTAVLGLDPDSMRLHKEDPLTTHACPGKKVSKPKFIQAVKDLLTRRHGVSILPGRRPEPRASLLPGAKFDGLGLDSESRERPKSAKPAGFGIEVDG